VSRVKINRIDQMTKRRTCTKLIRFSPEELRIVTDRARAAGRPVACYVRESTQGNSPHKRKTELSDTLIRALAQVCNRLAELSRIASEECLPCAADFDRAVAEVLEVIRTLD